MAVIARRSILQVSTLSTGILSVLLMCFIPMKVVGSEPLIGGILDGLQNSIDGVISKTTSNGSLFANKIARDLQLQVQLVKEGIHDELDVQWSKANDSEVQIISQLKSAVENLNTSVGNVQNIEDVAYLDAGSLLEKLPFLSKVPGVRRVEGAAQTFRGLNATYRIKIRGNITSEKYAVRLFKDGSWSNLPAEWIVRESPPYDIIIDIPGFSLENKFDDLKLSDLRLGVFTTIANRRWFEFWKNPEREVFSPVTIELLPKYPLTYRLLALSSVRSIDTTQTKIQKGALNFIPNCGSDGCNDYHTICVDVPEGAEPVDHIDPYDEGNWRFSAFDSYSKTSTGFCGVFHQHSQSINRNVSFDVTYHPLVDSAEKIATRLQRISVDELLNLDNFHPCVTKAGKPPLPEACKYSTQVTVDERISYSQTYAAFFDKNTVSYLLAVHTFFGDDYAAGKGFSSKYLKISPMEENTAFKSIVLTVDSPF